MIVNFLDKEKWRKRFQLVEGVLGKYFTPWASKIARFFARITMFIADKVYYIFRSKNECVLN